MLVCLLKLQSMKKIIFASGLLLVMGSCYNDKFDQLYPVPQNVPDLCDTVTHPSTFSASANAIITAKCGSSGCHDAATMQSGYNLTNHTNDSVASQRIKSRVAAGTMPPSTASQLNDCERKQLFSWINNGSKNN